MNDVVNTAMNDVVNTVSNPSHQSLCTVPRSSHSKSTLTLPKHQNLPSLCTPQPKTSTYHTALLNSQKFKIDSIYFSPLTKTPAPWCKVVVPALGRHICPFTNKPSVTARTLIKQMDAEKLSRQEKLSESTRELLNKQARIYELTGGALESMTNLRKSEERKEEDVNEVAFAKSKANLRLQLGKVLNQNTQHPFSECFLVNASSIPLP